MSRVVSLRLPDETAGRLERLARRFRRSLGETAGILLEEKLREEAFPFVEFRDAVGRRQAYVAGSRVAVWEVVFLARRLDGGAREVARYLEWPEERVASALSYAEAFPEEVEAADEAEATGLDQLKRRIPWIEAAE